MGVKFHFEVLFYFRTRRGASIEIYFMNHCFGLILYLFYFLYSILFYSLLLGYGSVMVRFLRPARRRFRSFSFRKKGDIFQLGFRVGFLLFSRRFSIGFSTAQIRKILFGSSFSHIEKQVFK